VVSRLSFAVAGARAEPFAVSPQLALRVSVEESTGADIYAIALRVQIMIEPQRRRYDGRETERVVDLFGTPERYGDTLRPMLWTHAVQMVTAFRGSTGIELPIACSYDFAIAAHKYLSALDDGDIPLNLLFSGTVIERGETRIASSFVPWSCEARFALPVRVWRETMDAHFPNAAWIRVSRDTLDELQRYKSAQGCPTWDLALTRLIDGAAAKR
jgi:hypothetical protein